MVVVDELLSLVNDGYLLCENFTKFFPGLFCVSISSVMSPGNYRTELIQRVTKTFSTDPYFIPTPSMSVIFLGRLFAHFQDVWEITRMASSQYHLFWCPIFGQVYKEQKPILVLLHLPAGNCPSSNQAQPRAKLRGHRDFLRNCLSRRVRHWDFSRIKVIETSPTVVRPTKTEIFPLFSNKVTSFYIITRKSITCTGSTYTGKHPDVTIQLPALVNNTSATVFLRKNFLTLTTSSLPAKSDPKIRVVFCIPPQRTTFFQKTCKLIITAYKSEILWQL